MKQKILLIIFLLQFLITSIFCQEIRIKIKSDYQEDSTIIRIVGTEITDDSVLNLVFVLPVEEYKKDYRYGVGIDECQKLIDNNFVSKNVVFIQPDYVRIPWYGNHISNKEIRQLDYTLEVIKYIKTKYSYLDKKIKVFLLGFSKSGWGAMNILISHAYLIDGILIWDAPLSTRGIEKWGMQQIFGNEDNFNKNYFLLRENGIKHEALKNKIIIIGGYDYFEDSSIEFLDLLDENEIEYFHDNTLSYPHKWDKNWIYKLLTYCNLILKTKY